MAVSPQIAYAFDDVAPRSGAVLNGGYTNDTAPLVRVELGDQAAAGDTLLLRDDGAAVGPALTLAVEDIDRGYADLPLTGLTAQWHLLTAVVAGAGGLLASSPAFALGVATGSPAAPVILGAADDAGPVTGALADGARTDDPTPTLHIQQAGLPPVPEESPGHAPFGGPALLGGTLQLYDGGTLLAEAQFGFGAELTITPGALGVGEHLLTAVAVDRAGNASAVSAPFRLLIGPDHPAQCATEAGGADDLLLAAAGLAELQGERGDDTLLGSEADDVLRGDRGADSLAGGLGDDWLVGGRGDDVLSGGAGDDWLSGGRGDDLLTGGPGADLFHVDRRADIERISDFNPAEGDRILLDLGRHAVFEAGADTVIDLGGRAQVILLGVRVSALGDGWLVET